MYLKTNNTAAEIYDDCKAGEWICFVTFALLYYKISQS